MKISVRRAYISQYADMLHCVYYMSFGAIAQQEPSHCLQHRRADGECSGHLSFARQYTPHGIEVSPCAGAVEHDGRSSLYSEEWLLVLGLASTTDPALLPLGRVDCADPANRVGLNNGVLAYESLASKTLA